jgi:hypothetical protein
MAPQHTAVITGSARDAAIGQESRWTSAVTASSWARLVGAEKILVCNELRCLPKDRPLPRPALYGERSGCDDQPQRSGYVQVARVDSSPGKWWVWSEFLLRARRCSEADRRRDAYSTRPCSRRRHIAYQPHRGRNHQHVGASRFRDIDDRALAGLRAHPAVHHAAGTLMGPHQPLLTPATPGWSHARQHSLEEGNNERQSRSD